MNPQNRNQIKIHHIMYALPNSNCPAHGSRERGSNPTDHEARPRNTCTQCSNAMQQPEQDDMNRQTGIRTERTDLNALTYINVFGQQLVGHFVLVQDVVVDSRAREGGAEEKTKESKKGIVLANCVCICVGFGGLIPPRRSADGGVFSGERMKKWQET